jgi:hypothetical protein
MIKIAHRFHASGKSGRLLRFLQRYYNIILMLARFFIGEFALLPQLIHHPPLGAP